MPSRDAKLAVLQWDDHMDGFRTAGLHGWEALPALRAGRCSFPVGPQAVCDPQVYNPSGA